jgi:hypothetical protein
VVALGTSEAHLALLDAAELLDAAVIVLDHGRGLTEA